MSAVPKQAAAGRDVFAPDVAAEKFEWQTGERRKVEAVEALPLRWPTTPKERFDLFDAWHDVAMQLVQRERKSFRLMAVAKKVINWQAGIITNSNADLALRAGCCSESTIKREVREYVDLGVLISEMGWRRAGTQIIRTRSLIPSLPITMPVGIILPESVSFDQVNSGPDRQDVDQVNSGPGDQVNSGPITIDHKKGALDAA